MVPRSSLVAALVVAALLQVRCSDSNSGDTVDKDQFREDVVYCEQAVGRLHECCPGFDASSVSCTRYFDQQDGCYDNTTIERDPALNTTESRCILQTSCGQLQRQGVCERAQTATPYQSYSHSTNDDDSHDSDGSTHAPVCP